MRKQFRGAAWNAVWILATPMFCAGAPHNTRTIWAIGTPDNSGYEFTAGAVSALNYEMGRSRDKDWRRTIQAGEKNPPEYAIRFRLDGVPHSAVVTLDIRYTGIAPRALVVRTNTRRGYFMVRPAAARDLDETTSYMPLYSGQQFRIPVQLQAGPNEVGISFLGEGGSALFDAITLSNEPADRGLRASVEPTIFFRNQGDKLVEVTEIVLHHSTRLPAGKLTLYVGDAAVTGNFVDDGYDFGERVVEVAVPVQSKTQKYTLSFIGQKFTGEYRAQKRWTLFAALSIHNDIGFTDSQPSIQTLDTRNIDGALDLIRTFPFYRFNLETSWQADNYLHARTKERWSELIADARTDRLGINAFYLNLLTGLCTGEELYRALYFTSWLKHAYEAPMNFATITDVPSYTWFLPTLLHGSGIHMFAAGSDQFRGPILEKSRLNEESPFWWEGSDGSRVLTWLARNYQGLFRLTGKGGNPERMRRSIAQFLARFERSDYAPDAVLVYGLYTDNSEIGSGEAGLIERWNNEYAFPKIIASTEGGYYDYIADRFGSKLPVFRGDGGAYWEDGAASSARETSLNRSTQALLPEAEYAATIARILNPQLRYPTDEFQSAWKQLLFYDEHSWGSYHSVTEPDRAIVRDEWNYKKNFAEAAYGHAKDLLTRSLSAIVQQISLAGPTIFLFNPSSQARSGMVQIDLDSDRELIDEQTGETKPFDIVEAQDGFNRVRFVANNVPGLGYKAFLVRKTAIMVSHNLAAKSWSIESPYYRLDLDPSTGAITHVFDKELGQDLVDVKAPYELNELLYVSGGKGSRIVETIANLPPARLTVEKPSKAVLLENVRTPIGARIRIRAEASHIPKLETEITLYKHTKRIDIVNRFLKDEMRDKEAVYFAFPFALTSPELSYQLQNTFAHPETDELPGAAREWFSTQDLIIARNSRATIAWATPDAPMVTLGDINRGLWPEHWNAENAHIYSYVMNNYWFTNYRAFQSGEFKFRYSIVSGPALNAREVNLFDQSARWPLLVYDNSDKLHVNLGPVQRRLPPASGKFVEIDGPVRLSTIKTAEDGNGIVIRLLTVSDEAGYVVLRSPLFQIRQAWLTNGVEENSTALPVDGGAVRVPVLPRQYTTIRIVPSA